MIRYLFDEKTNARFSEQTVTFLYGFHQVTKKRNIEQSINIIIIKRYNSNLHINCVLESKVISSYLTVKNYDKTPCIIRL